MMFESGRFLVAVYGSLKRGYSNHRFLRGARFVGHDRLDCLTLYDLGSYPGAKLEPSRGVVVELYRVNQAGFRRLDLLEGYRQSEPERGLYDRQQLNTRFGPAWVYVYNRPVKGRRRIARGNW
ncbi:gamma-glutamylcyclotransferase family protein [Marinobacter sp. BGYM27]|uniref:gamma-glutamylcyclotransferase family protein n=1 Tax=Marinobacter sp. BGYM27 TaxID=2975597 RepID=UPI0021A37110|nr:gamma-glutamylcyclotransferase family protein [Marinobacter sp. BGYM27]MDG5499915.1 gamma-glutamylcyclotransferase [Marinobacter sp. BGYM27]